MTQSSLPTIPSDQTPPWDQALAASAEMGVDPAGAESRRVLRRLARRTTPSQRGCVEAQRSRSPRDGDRDTVLAGLTDRGHIRVLPSPPGPARPSRRHEVHPAARCVGPLGSAGVRLVDGDEQGRST